MEGLASCFASGRPVALRSYVFFSFLDRRTSSVAIHFLRDLVKVDADFKRGRSECPRGAVYQSRDIKHSRTCNEACDRPGIKRINGQDEAREDGIDE